MSSRIALILCIALAALFAGLSYSAIITKSATYDEPVHFGAAYAHVYLHDDRSDPENPVLWKYWPMLAIRRADLAVNQNDPAWREAGKVFPDKHWAVDALFEGHPDAGTRLINRARFAMMLLGVITCLAAAWWAHRIAGPWAAIGTAALIALDPNFLAHAPLIKNDVPMTLAMLLALIALWRVGRKLTPLNAIALAVSCATSINVKLSAVILPLIVICILVIRAVMPQVWIVCGRAVDTRLRRALVVLGMSVLIGFTTFILTWAVYGFRYAPTNDPSLIFQADRPFIGGIDHLVLFVERHHLLPEAFCAGLLRQHSALQQTRNYLLGSINGQGWWYYFPFAFLVKTPAATLLAAVCAICFAIKFRSAKQRTFDAWTLICLGVPGAIFLLSAMSSTYNHGFRSVLPIVPLVYIAIASVFARAVEQNARGARVFASALLIALAIESTWAYPNYLAFFNTAAGGSRGGLNLLGDSNLDWGQDLSLLLKWHREHPDEKMYLAYWGGVDPITFGLNYTPLPGYYAGIPDIAPNPREPGVLVISSTLLQGIYIREPWNAMYAEIRTWQPREVLGGSIYVYDFPSREMGGTGR